MGGPGAERPRSPSLVFRASGTRTSFPHVRLPPRIPAPATGPLPSWPPVHTARGPGGSSGAHAHHAMHVVLSHDGVLRVEVDGELHRVPGVLTAPDVKHAIDARGSEVTLVFLDPESDAGERLRATLRGPARWLTSAERDRIVRDDAAESMMERGGSGWTDWIVCALGVERPPRRHVHPRVRKLLRHLSMLPVSADTSLEALAAAVELSPGRLMHVFTQSVGIPLRPYLGWLRLQRAASAVVSGVPLSQAAALAGFVDAAHMTRSFRAMFGTTPSSLRAEAASSSRPTSRTRRTVGA
jgi:AraC-like DNA-binding protein